mmetsp:Transcript_73660/g.115295  ORF Transcript_73660/g.115295 Transcript_73660/m.115295 type:complete len:89 (-) Transcript_73660:143-409(-)
MHNKLGSSEHAPTKVKGDFNEERVAPPASLRTLNSKQFAVASTLITIVLWPSGFWSSLPWLRDFLSGTAAHIQESPNCEKQEHKEVEW